MALLHGGSDEHALRTRQGGVAQAEARASSRQSRQQAEEAETGPCSQARPHWHQVRIHLRRPAARVRNHHRPRTRGHAEDRGDRPGVGGQGATAEARAVSDTHRLAGVRVDLTEDSLEEAFQDLVQRVELVGGRPGYIECAVSSIPDGPGLTRWLPRETLRARRTARHLRRKMLQQRPHGTPPRWFR